MARDGRAAATGETGSIDPAGRDVIGNSADLAKFTALVALLAIFSDAAIGHALLWENDPYWTYWITKTFLIATVFGLGTAWLGLGPGRGAVITAVHTLILTIYYWTFSPVGLPSHPEWLDLEHTWATGVPVHFGVIYLGYLVALWLWLHRRVSSATPEPTLSRQATTVLLAGLAIVLGAGLLASLAVGNFPGFTWFLVRLLLTIPFLLVWWGLAGRDRMASIVGGVTLALVWGTYGHYLGPSGLPDTPLRILDPSSPPATVTWMGYRDLWLISVPIYLVVMVSILVLPWLMSRNDPQVARSRGAASGGRRQWTIPALITVAAIGIAGIYAARVTGDEGTAASVRATGAAQVERGPWYSDDFVEATAELDLDAVDQGARVSPLPPHDKLSISARIQHPDGTIYELRASEPMVDDPLGRFGTWWGVGLDHAHHGESGIGSKRLPPIHSEVAVFGLGELHANGTLIAAGVPVHVMTADEGLPGRLELNVGDEQAPVPGVPDGHLRIVWADYSGGADSDPERARYLLGAVTLLGLLWLSLLLVRNERLTE